MDFVTGGEEGDERFRVSFVELEVFIPREEEKKNRDLDTDYNVPVIVLVEVAFCGWAAIEIV